MRAARGGGLWRAMSGLGLWMLCFLSLYGGHALGCLYPLLLDKVVGLPMLSWLLVLVWLLWLAALSWLAVGGWRALRAVRAKSGPQQMSRFMTTLTSTVDIAALASTVIIGLPLLWMPVCA